MALIPKILHFCFGMTPDFGGKKWGLSHYVCLASAIKTIKPQKSFLYFQYEPTGPWWEQTKKLIDTVKIEAPKEIFGNPIEHPAHRADVVRLEALLEHGGIYLDTDVFVHKPFDDLLKFHTVLGAEGQDATWGTANAVILAEPKAAFIKMWYDHYKSFRSTESKYWNEHSVQLPLYLSKKYPELVFIANYRAFFWPLWTKKHLEWIFNSTDECVFPDTYATHLWDGKSFRYTKDLTPGDVRSTDTNFHLWARPYVVEFEDDFGRESQPVPWQSRRPGQAEVIRDNVENQLRRMRSRFFPRRFEL